MAIKIQGTTVIDDSKNVLVGNGSESAPSITAVADTNTGIFFPAADTIALTTNGTQRLKADANGITTVISPQSSVPWTFSVRTADDFLSISNNVVHPYEVVFVPDLTSVASGSTITVEASGQLTPLIDDYSAFQYDKANNRWLSVDSTILSAKVQTSAVDRTPGRLVSVDYIDQMIGAQQNNIGVPGEAGFGVGIYPGTLPAGFTALAGSHIPTSDTYGNYSYSDGSIMCWIPKFYYRIGSPLSPRYAVYGLNAIDIASAYDFKNETEANAAGYALHRAFIDGGVTQNGFMYDKYLCSKNGDIASSIKNGLPLSSASGHNPFSGLTGITNAYYGAIDAAKTRGTSFFCSSRFQFAALALLATAHGQAATSSTYCAWYDSGLTKNFPKGNNNYLTDYNDSTVKWESDGYTTSGAASAKTGSAGYGGGAGNIFAKSTHNGQACGVADLNGNMWEINIGMTCIAAGKTITGATQANPCVITIVGHGYSTDDVVMITSVQGMTQLNDKIYKITKINDDTFSLNGIDSSSYSAWTTAGTVTKGTFYVAKSATSMKNFTSGNSGATDHWGATGVAAMMDPITINFATSSGVNGFDQRYGNGTNQVLSAETSGNNWALAGLGMPIASGMSTSGSNLFGGDYYYQYIRNELCLISGGFWSYPSAAGVWDLSLAYYRTHSNYGVGFRSAAYV